MSDHGSDRERAPTRGSTLTVLVAGAANLAIAIAKTAAGVLSGSSAMLAEAAHSFADTLNQAFLLTAIKRSAKPADPRHPFGYGMERYFWSLLAAVGIFVLGAGFSVYQGIDAIVRPRDIESLQLTYLVLLLSLVFEGASWMRAALQVRNQARAAGSTTVRQAAAADDPALKTVLFEDTAALLGIVVAAAGVTLHEVTGGAYWDGAASIAIGLLLVAVAFALGSENKALLLGQSVDDETLAAIHDEIDGSPGIDHVVELLTMRLGPGQLLVAARVDVEDQASGGALEQFADNIEDRLRSRFPDVRHVFLDPTDAPSGARSGPRGAATHSRNDAPRIGY